MIGEIGDGNAALSKTAKYALRFDKAIRKWRGDTSNFHLYDVPEMCDIIYSIVYSIVYSTQMSNLRFAYHLRRGQIVARGSFSVNQIKTYF